MSEKDLIPQSERTKEEQKRIARMGGIASGKTRREKKLMSQIYAEVMAKKHNAKGKTLSDVVDAVLDRGDSASVSMMKEMREATEGSKLLIDPIKIRVVFGNDDNDTDDIPADDIPADPV
jgi:hypothetical protein